ncbi:hypothetical protein [Aquibium microcysteis]|uniref:hypothetical protein n=1 Tax=Aquibium microcysteis TaxID=675281 RepID=UPI00165D1CE7|nr:hypothetical protein [Aquibium microcysteis]
MSLIVTVTWHNPNPDTIANKLAARLGREPTHQELKDEVCRILREANEGMKARKS